MKVLLSILLLASTIVHGQINQRTIELREKYARSSVMMLKSPINFHYPSLSETKPMVHDAKYFLVSSHVEIRTNNSIQIALNHYSQLKQTPDYSGFVTLGYALFTKQQFVNSPFQPESIRFFPAKNKE